MAIRKRNSHKIFKKQAQQALHATLVDQTCGTLWHVGACWIKWKPNYMCSLSRRFAGDKARRADRLTCWPTVPPTAAVAATTAIAKFAFSFSHICCCSAAFPIITTPASSLWPAAGVCVWLCMCVCGCLAVFASVAKRVYLTTVRHRWRRVCGGRLGVATPSAGVVWCARKLLLQWNLSGLNLLKCRRFWLYAAWAEIRFGGFTTRLESTRLDSGRVKFGEY